LNYSEFWDNFWARDDGEEPESDDKRVIVSVSRKYNNAGDTVHRPGTKKVWKVYYILLPSLKFGDFKTDAISAQFYKAQIRKKRLLTCTVCGSYQVHFVKKDKDLQKAKCVNKQCRSNDPDYDPEDE